MAIPANSSGYSLPVLRAQARLVVLCILTAAMGTAAAQVGEVRGVRLDDAQTLAWDAEAGAAGYHVYRGDAAGLPGSYGACRTGSVQGTSTPVPDVPSPGAAFTYLVSGFDADGEGGLGAGEAGDRLPDTACIPARKIFPPTSNGVAADGVEDGALARQNADVVVRGWDPQRKAVVAGVVASTGELIVTDVDLFVPGRGLDWGMFRTYRSQVEWDGPLGHGWFFADSVHLRDGGGGDVLLCDGGGRCETFTSGPTGFISPPGEFGVLHAKADGSYALREPDGTVLRFHPIDGTSTQGDIETRENSSGGRISYLYDHQGLLTTVVDSLGREIRYEYDTNGRIVAVTDFGGRRVEYGYDGEGNLTSVRSPVVTGTPNGNDFLAGKTTTYSYTTGFADARLNHNLRTITDPLGQVWLSNTYSSDPDDVPAGSLTFDRVVLQDVGGTGASGVPAGGAVSFSYEPLNPGADPDLTDLERRRARITDPNGNQEEHVHNARGHELTHVLHTRGVRPGDPPTFTTEMRYNEEGLLLQTDLPVGGSILRTYDSAGSDRYRQGNLLEVRLVADPVRGDGHGGDQSDLVETFTYEPVYNQVATHVDARGNDPTYRPQNGGSWSAARYTTTWRYDYQEGDPAVTGLDAYLSEWGISLGATETALGDLNGDGRTDQIAGHAVRLDEPVVQLDPKSNQAGLEGDAQQEVVTLWRHNDLGQLVAEIDPVGVEISLVYYPESDPDGDGNPTPPPPDGRVLDALDGGFLHTESRDGTQLESRRYDTLGHLTDVIDGRGVLTRQIYNSLDQLVEVRRGAATADKSGPDGDPATGFGESGLTAPSYKVRFEYDAADNLVRRQMEDRGDTRGFGGWIDTSWTYDILDRPVEMVRSSVPGATLSFQLRYDGNGNRSRLIFPEGNEVQWEWDERDLLYRSIEGAGSADAATTTFDYDGNGSLVRTTDPLGEVVEFEYDGIDRAVRWIDEVGGAAEFFYDPASNMVRQLVQGAVGGASPTDRSGSANVTLSDTQMLYDELGRRIGVDRLLGMPAGAVTGRPVETAEGALVPGDGMVNAILEYDAASRLTFVTSDLGPGDKWTFEYDGLDRLTRRVSPDGSSRSMTYDEADNLIELEETELNSSTGTPQVFLTTYFYDALSRKTMSADNLGRAWRREYDSLDDLTLETDPLGPAGMETIQRRSPAHAGESVPINGHGNVTRYAYDGLGRRTSWTQVLTASGMGDGTTSPAPDTSNPHNPGGEINRWFAYDGNSRLVSSTDPRGNVTSFEYDALDRRIRTTYSDATTEEFLFDRAGNLLQRTDPIGSVLAYTYDNAHRPTLLSITRGAGVEGTTLQTFEYDGLDRLTRAVDNNEETNPDDDAELLLHYDLLGRIVEEQQRLSGLGTFGAIDYAYQADDLVTALTYPSGRRVSYGHDAAGRLVSVTDAGSSGGQVDFTYVGMERVVSRSAGSSLTTDVTYDGVRRVVSLTQSSGGTVLAGFDYDYDGAGRVISERWNHDASGSDRRGVDYGYDSAGRMTSSTEALFDVAGMPVGVPDDEQEFTLDAAGSFPEMARNGVSFGATPNNLNLYDENQCCGTSSDDGMPDDFLDDLSTPGADGRNLAHDASGSQTKTGDMQLFYDALGRPVRVARLSDGMNVARYRYDALNRLMLRTIVNPGVANDQYLRYYSGSSVIEVQDEKEQLRRQVAVTLRGTALWQLREFGGGMPPAEHLLLDAGDSTRALVTAAGTVLERMTYDAGGVPVFRDAANAAKVDAVGLLLDESDFGVSELLRGLDYLPELGSRASSHDGDWGGAYISGGSLYDPNQGRSVNSLALLRGIEKSDIRRGMKFSIGGGGGSSLRMNKAELVDAMASGSNARVGRNPQTGASLRIRAKAVAKFKAGKALADTVKRAAGGGGGHVTVLKAKAVAKFKAGAALAHAVNIAAGGGAGGGGGGHLTLLELADGRHHGHVTVLKSADGR
ncbi:MAG: DUF6531 domain-containing protein, partial [Acidobacteriota bacterium]|nr:DUF6531 domain-containing protein [Acidobacteriota bacterium]